MTRFVAKLMSVGFVLGELPDFSESQTLWVAESGGDPTSQGCFTHSIKKMVE